MVRRPVGTSPGRARRDDRKVRWPHTDPRSTPRPAYQECPF